MGKATRLVMIVGNLALRSDVREMILEFDRKYDLTLCVLAARDVVVLPQGITARVVPPLPTTLKNRVVNFLYLFGRSRHKAGWRNFLGQNMQRLYKNEVSALQKNLAYVKLFFRYLLGGNFSYDTYLNSLDVLTDIIPECDLCFAVTGQRNPHAFAIVSQRKIPLLYYLHSWDHPAKLDNFKRNNCSYLTWSKLLSRDLNLFHSVDLSQTSVVGTSQFAFIQEYLAGNATSERTANQEPYLYFAASFGKPPAAAQEVKVLQWVADVLMRISPTYKIIFRPYPNLTATDIYDRVSKLSNVVIEKEEVGNGLITQQRQAKKCKTIMGARAVIHCGTTIGLETAFLNVPVIYCCPRDLATGCSLSDPLHLQFAWNAYHLTTYYELEGSPNVINSKDKLVPLLEMLRNEVSGAKLLDYNDHLQKIANLRPLADITTHMQDTINKIVSG